MYKWYLPTVSEIVAVTDPETNTLPEFPAQRQIKAEREWSGAVAALNQLLGKMLDVTKPAVAKNPQQGAPTPVEGVVLSGPFPVLNHTNLTDRLATWMLTVASPGEIVQLLPAADSSHSSSCTAVPTLPLLPNDPLAAEQFCLVLTPEFSLVMVLGETVENSPAFLFSFDPEVARQVWRSLEARIKLTVPKMLSPLTQVVKRFPPVTPDYQTVTQFSRLMLAHLPQPHEWDGKRPVYPEGRVFEEVGKSLAVGSSAPAKPSKTQAIPTSAQNQGQRATVSVSPGSPPVPKAAKNGKVLSSDAEPAEGNSLDTELLKAIAHEVRTPLTTIRTLTRLLLRRKELHPDVIKRLKIIDQECTEQIDRFNLIFRAAELETTKTRNLIASLTPTSLDQVLQQNIPRWQQQATQYNHTLDIVLPKKMPLVVTDPTMLDQALTGLIDRITHNLPAGSHIQVQVSLAGHQLKLQLESHPQANQAKDSKGGDNKNPFGFAPALKSIGQLLMFQPETGNLSLNMAVTKNLFQALGGKLIVRQHPQQGEVLTIFLPLEMRKE